MIHELRVYRCTPGKLPALLERFEKVTIPLWKKHGIRPGYFWTTMVGESNHELIYTLIWESLAEREAKMPAFQNDPEWIAKRKESERDGSLVASVSNQLLAPVPFSPLK